jgi:hypothetical protein
MADCVSADWLRSLICSYERSNRISSPELQQATLALIAKTPAASYEAMYRDILWSVLPAGVPLDRNCALKVAYALEWLADYASPSAKLVRHVAV